MRSHRRSECVRRSDTGLRGEMDNAIKFFTREQILHGGLVREIDVREFEPVAPFQLRQARALQRDVVIVVEIVEADHMIAPVEQHLGGVEADEPGRACHKDFHERPNIC